MIGFDADNCEYIQADMPVIVPPRGCIEAEQEATIAIKYLPGMPKKFEKKLLLQISHYAPEELVITGEAGFADIMLDLPRLENDDYKRLYSEAQQELKAKEDAKNKNLSALYQGINGSPELDLQVELDRLAIQNFIKTKQETASLTQSDGLMKEKSVNKIAALSTTSINDIVHEIPTLTKSLNMSVHTKDDMGDNVSILNQSVSNLKPYLNAEHSKPQQQSKLIQDSMQSFSKREKKLKPVLPDYLLDFGHVILGTVKTHVIRAANMSKILASFDIERQNFSKTGFLIDLEKVKNLPNEESVEFVITFDPRGANLGLGPVEHVIPLTVSFTNN